MFSKKKIIDYLTSKKFGKVNNMRLNINNINVFIQSRGDKKSQILITRKEKN